MTYIERIERALRGDDARESYEPEYINRLILMAYFLGKSRAAKEICDQHSVQVRTAREKARTLRYHVMAEAILPSSDTIYHPDYSGDYVHTFGDDLYGNGENSL